MKYLIIIILFPIVSFGQVLNYKKKTNLTVSAVIYNGSNLAEVQTIAPTIEQFAGNVIGFTTPYGRTEAIVGFYVVKDNGSVLIMSPTEFAATFTSLTNELKGSLVIDNLLAALVSANLTQSEKASLVTKCSSVFIALKIGELQGARFLANALTTDAVFTAARKTFLLNQIDAQLL